ncbi:MAG: hypothetical protein JSW70_01530 [Syntrophobacterales bacterium]|nr:MAG: hypothetical protein JSW70_01530 [Syntrophobacterales bacterium]
MPNRSSLWKTFLKLITSFRENEYTVIIALAIFIGLLGGFGAIGFRLLIGTFQIISYGSGPRGPI